MQIVALSVGLGSVFGLSMAVVESALSNHSIGPDGKLWTTGGGREVWVPRPLAYLRRWAIRDPEGWNVRDYYLKLFGAVGSLIATSLFLAAAIVD